MKHEQIAEYINRLQSEGRYSFTKKEVIEELNLSNIAAIRSLQRLAKKKRIALVKRGFYVIVPPEYRTSGILPPTWFIHELMQFLDRPYYIGLLSAAALHGSAHQQPQVFQVVTDRPERDIKVAGLRIQFFSKSNLSDTPVQKMKTPTGFINVSTPAATALDLVRYEARIGGLEVAASVLEELAESLDAGTLSNVAEREPRLAYVQRLGFLFDKTGHAGMTDDLAHTIAFRNAPYVLLDPKGSRLGHPHNKRWRIIENMEVEFEQ